MIVGEILILIAILAGGGVGLATVFGASKNAREKRAENKKRRAEMQQDLRRVLWSRDYRQLDDFQVMWADELTEQVRIHVKARRDELYVEANP